MRAGWGQWEQRMCLSNSQSHFPAEMIPQSQRGASVSWKLCHPFWACPPPTPPSISLSVASRAHPQWSETSQASSSSVFRNRRVGATDTHQYPAAYYFLPVLAPLQGPAWQVDEVHEKAQQWASFPGMLLLTRFTNQAALHHPRLNGEPDEWGSGCFFFFFAFFFFFFSVSSLDPVIVSAGISNSLLRLPGSKCFSKVLNSSLQSQLKLCGWEMGGRNCPWDCGVREPCQDLRLLQQERSQAD